MQDENITITIPKDWNEMITFDEIDNKVKVDNKNLIMTAFNLNRNQYNIPIIKGEDQKSFFVTTEDLRELFLNSLNNLKKEHKKRTVLEYYFSRTKEIISILSFVKKEFIEFNLLEIKGDFSTDALILNLPQTTRTTKVYYLNIFRIFEDIDVDSLKEHLKNKICYRPLEQLDDIGLLKNINPINKKEIGLEKNEVLSDYDYCHIWGGTNNTGMYIHNSEIQYYPEYLDLFLNVRFCKEYVETDYYNRFFIKQLSKEKLIDKYKLSKRKNTSKYVVYSNEKDTSAVFDPHSNYCRVLKTSLDSFTMEVTYFARNGRKMATYYVQKKRDLNDFYKINEKFNKLSDNGFCISSILYDENNKEIEHILRMKNKNNKYNNFSKSVFLLFQKYNSLNDRKMINNELELRVLKIMKDNCFDFTTIRKLLREYNTDKLEVLTEETVMTLEMIYGY